MLELKAVFCVAFVWGWVAIPDAVGDTAAAAIVLASFTVSMGVLYRLAKKGVRGVRRWSKGIDHMLDLPAWQQKTDQRLERIEKSAQADITVVNRIEQDPPTRP